MYAKNVNSTDALRSQLYERRHFTFANDSVVMHYSLQVNSMNRKLHNYHSNTTHWLAGAVKVSITKSLAAALKKS